MVARLNEGMHRTAAWRPHVMPSALARPYTFGRAKTVQFDHGRDGSTGSPELFGLLHDGENSMTHHKRPLMRNVVWGTLTMIAFWLQLVAGILVASVFVAELRQELRETELEFFRAYFLAALICGPILGALRPLAKSRWGRSVVGGLMSSVAVTTLLAVLGTPEVFGSRALLTTVVVCTFTVGAAMTPLFAHAVRRGLVPDVDAFLAGVWHEPPADRVPKDDDDAWAN